MDKKTKVLFGILIVLLLGSILVTFYRYIIKKDYLIFAHVECDSGVEPCFYVPCEQGDTECDPNEIEYYKKIYKKAFNIEICNSEDPACKPLVCKNREKDCKIINCTQDNIEEGEGCSK